MRKTTCILAMFVSALALIGCGPTTAELSAKIKSSLQDTFWTDPKFIPYRIVVTNVSLVKAHGNEYRGIVTVVSGERGAHHELPITVTADGSNTIWEVSPEAMLSLTFEDPGPSDSYLPANQSSSISADAIRLVKRDYRPRIDVQSPVSFSDGRITAAETENGGRSNMIDIKVQFSPSGHAEQCEWIISFPKSNHKEYSEISMPGCAKSLFEETPVSPPGD